LQAARRTRSCTCTHRPSWQLRATRAAPAPSACRTPSSRAWPPPSSRPMFPRMRSSSRRCAWTLLTTLPMLRTCGAACTPRGAQRRSCRSRRMSLTRAAPRARRAMRRAACMHGTCALVERCLRSSRKVRRSRLCVAASWPPAHAASRRRATAPPAQRARLAAQLNDCRRQHLQRLQAAQAADCAPALGALRAEFAALAAAAASGEAAEEHAFASL
jgi:hypothetical protein